MEQPRFTPPAIALDALQRLPGALAAAGFRGDVSGDPALLAAMSTDNSVYAIRPDLVVAPRDGADVACLLRVLGEAHYVSLPVTARGGGTGTNGQSLNVGVIVDFQKHMNRLLAVNAEEQWAEVEPGIVLEELNGKLAAHGLFFAPNTSTASRCTVGGMVGTDASGKGSRIYGKTSDNVLGLDLVTEGGLLIDSFATPPAEAARLLAAARVACAKGRDALLARVPDLSRRFTGYDLGRALEDPDRFDWWRLAIGAEGTLGLVTRIRVKLHRKPRLKRLVVIGFESFEAALNAGTPLLAHEPLAIEIMDEWVQALAEKAGVLGALPMALRARDGQPVSYSFVEFVGDDETALSESVARLAEAGLRLPGAIAVHVARDEAEIAALWQVRAAAVGLLGKVKGNRRPVAFVEDCVVPVENLAAFVRDFTALITEHGLAYGIYGHVDVGCLHVRPALDLGEAADRATLQAISDEVFALTRKHGGIFWGEHGKGVRGAYLAEFVGPEAYGAFQAIKQAFDPKARFNPGKLVAHAAPLMGISSTPMRAPRIDAADPLAPAFSCNGNAQCLSYPRAGTMCPSFKATRDLTHSPKGRAEALRAWHQAKTSNQLTAELEDSVLSALDGCLGCKACATGCPVQVDIPEMKSHFLDDIHRRRGRKAGDWAALLMESHAALLDRLRAIVAPIANALMPLASRLTGLADLPAFARKGIAAGPYPQLPARDIAGRGFDAATVFLFQDPFTALFDPEASLAIAGGLAALGYQPVFVALVTGGKAAHGLGDRARFLRHARALTEAIDQVAKAGRPMIGLDPAFVAMLRQDYAKAGLTPAPVLLVQEFLADEIARGASFPRPAKIDWPTTFLPHCNEDAKAVAAWKTVLAALGAPTKVVAAGCCGMAGLFGHRARSLEVSRAVFDLAWKDAVAGETDVAASGFSCRCQLERFSAARAEHPLAALARASGTAPIARASSGTGGAA
ncbi:FAD-binding oxidoreductase [Rhizobium rhizosphaerae]|uniref:FAD-binding oxidoreductase n=1 Tax=Xaviernesmea rhizosphaerae TaxID=1672749 RepID=A0ABX3P8V7_9HYPH|nr:FAD-binding and (Fe-S)-binding domain-containing protein [Xaviernesmea rhizosphaerae]OQP83988.1 FAD-binding oxidoreductase [Xaviernesmea rhizosphaerae]